MRRAGFPAYSGYGTRQNNRYVAVKVPIRFDEVTGTQFTKELTIWEGLHHKNIVELYASKHLPPSLYRDGICCVIPGGDAFSHR